MSLAGRESDTATRDDPFLEADDSVGSQTRVSGKGAPYTVLDRIGEGSFGRVYRGRRNGTGQIVALKFIPKKDRTTKDLDALRTEIDILRRLQHPNIIRMLDAYETPREFCVVTEYAPGELFRVLQDDKRLPLQVVRSIAAQLCRALSYLHAHRIIHRDMKPQNVLIGANGRVKLCDFGFARAMSLKTLVLTSIKGTPLYMAPELVREQPYDHMTDVWALGVILYELYVGDPPYYTDSIYRLVQMIVREPVRFPTTCPPELRSFLSRMLVKNPRGRAGWPELLGHPFIAGVVRGLDEDDDRIDRLVAADGGKTPAAASGAGEDSIEAASDKGLLDEGKGTASRVDALCAPQTRLEWFLRLHRSEVLDAVRPVSSGQGGGSASAADDTAGDSSYIGSEGDPQLGWEDDELTIVPLGQLLDRDRHLKSAGSAAAGADAGHMDLSSTSTDGGVPQEHVPPVLPLVREGGSSSAGRRSQSESGLEASSSKDAARAEGDWPGVQQSATSHASAKSGFSPDVGSGTESLSARGSSRFEGTGEGKRQDDEENDESSDHGNGRQSGAASSVAETPGGSPMVTGKQVFRQSEDSETSQRSNSPRHSRSRPSQNQADGAPVPESPPRSSVHRATGAGALEAGIISPVGKCRRGGALEQGPDDSAGTDGDLGSARSIHAAIGRQLDAFGVGTAQPGAGGARGVSLDEGVSAEEAKNRSRRLAAAADDSIDELGWGGAFEEEAVGPSPTSPPRRVTEADGAALSARSARSAESPSHRVGLTSAGSERGGPQGLGSTAATDTVSGARYGRGNPSQLPDSGRSLGMHEQEAAPDSQPKPTLHSPPTERADARAAISALSGSGYFGESGGDIAPKGTNSRIAGSGSGESEAGLESAGSGFGSTGRSRGFDKVGSPADAASLSRTLLVDARLLGQQQVIAETGTAGDGFPVTGGQADNSEASRAFSRSSEGAKTVQDGITEGRAVDLDLWLGPGAGASAAAGTAGRLAALVSFTRAIGAWMGSASEEDLGSSILAGLSAAPPLDWLAKEDAAKAEGQHDAVPLALLPEHIAAAMAQASTSRQSRVLGQATEQLLTLPLDAPGWGLAVSASRRAALLLVAAVARGDSEVPRGLVQFLERAEAALVGSARTVTAGGSEAGTRTTGTALSLAISYCAVALAVADLTSTSSTDASRHGVAFVAQQVLAVSNNSGGAPPLRLSGSRSAALEAAVGLLSSAEIGSRRCTASVIAGLLALCAPESKCTGLIPLRWIVRPDRNFLGPASEPPSVVSIGWAAAASRRLATAIPALGPTESSALRNQMLDVAAAWSDSVSSMWGALSSRDRALRTAASLSIASCTECMSPLAQALGEAALGSYGSGIDSMRQLSEALLCLARVLGLAWAVHSRAREVESTGIDGETLTRLLTVSRTAVAKLCRVRDTMSIQVAAALRELAEGSKSSPTAGTPKEGAKSDDILAPVIALLQSGSLRLASRRPASRPHGGDGAEGASHGHPKLRPRSARSVAAQTHALGLLAPGTGEAQASKVVGALAAAAKRSPSFAVILLDGATDGSGDGTGWSVGRQLAAAAVEGIAGPSASLAAKMAYLAGNVCRHSPSAVQWMITGLGAGGRSLSIAGALCLVATHMSSSPDARRMAMYAIGNAAYQGPGINAEVASSGCLEHLLDACDPTRGGRDTFDERAAANAAGAIGNLVRHESSLVERMIQLRAADLMVSVCRWALERVASGKARSVPAFALNCLFSLGTLLVHERIRTGAVHAGVRKALQGWVGAVREGGSTWDRYVQRALGRFGSG